MKSRPEPCLDKHVETKHDRVGAAKGCCDDDGHAFVSVGQVAAEDEADHKDDIAEDVVRYVACSKQDCHEHKPKSMRDLESVSWMVHTRSRKKRVVSLGCEQELTIHRHRSR